MKDILKTQFNTTILTYNTNPDSKQAWNLIQGELKCCGVEDPSDWRPIFKNDTVPSSCCTILPPEAAGCIQEYILSDHKDGCKQKLYDFLDSNALVLGAVGVIIAVVQVRNCDDLKWWKIVWLKAGKPII